MTQALAPQQKVNNVRTMLEKLKPQIALALPRHMTADRMARVAMTCILRTPKLLDCDPTSLAGAIVTCSQLGLEPDPLLGHAHLVPFRNRKRNIYEVVVIPGYKGLMKLSRNSGEIATIDAHEVHKADVFRYAYGLKPVLHHVPFQGDGDAGAVTHYYAVAIMKGGAGQFVVMTRGEIEAHKTRFVEHVRDDSPWVTDFDAMAKKTCIRMLAKLLPASVELQKAAALDEQAEAGIPQDLGSIIDVSGVIVDTETGEVLNGGGTKLDALTEELKKEPPAQAGPAPAASPTTQPPAAAQTDTDEQPGLLGGPANQTTTKEGLLDQLAAEIKAKGLKASHVIQLTEKNCGVSDYNHAEAADLVKLLDAVAAIRKEK